MERHFLLLRFKYVLAPIEDPSKFRTILKKQEMLTPLHGYVIGQGYKRKMLYEQILFTG